MPKDRDRPDKTVFKPSANRVDETIVCSTPGGQSSSRRPAARFDDPYASTQQQSAPVSPAFASPTPTSNIDFNAQQFNTTYGLNSLVNASAVLIAAFSKIRVSISHPDVAGIKQQLISELKAFDTKARAAGIKSEIVHDARYILCTILDQAVLTTPWGKQSDWAQRTLLSIFHRDAGGGEKFFQMLQERCKSPAENIEILELMYICISLGYEGKYKNTSGCRDELDKIRKALFEEIRNQRGKYESSLSPHWQGLEKDQRLGSTLVQYVPMWVVASIVAGVLLLGYSGFRAWMYASTEHITKELAEISTTDFTVEESRIDSKTDLRIDLRIDSR